MLSPVERDGSPEEWCSSEQEGCVDNEMRKGSYSPHTLQPEACSICQDILSKEKVPRSFLCGHTFCEGCIKELLAHTHTSLAFGRRMKCPVCKRSLGVPKDGIDGFAINLSVCQMNDMILEITQNDEKEQKTNNEWQGMDANGNTPCYQTSEMGAKSKDVNTEYIKLHYTLKKKEGVLTIPKSSKISDVKSMISKNSNIPYDELEIVHRGCTMEDHYKVADWNIKNGSTLHVKLPPANKVVQLWTLMKFKGYSA